MSERISYTDFLKEGSFTDEQSKRQIHGQENVSKPFRLIPDDIANQADEKAFWRKLRHFFRTGQQINPIKGNYVPALIAPYLIHGNWDMQYPYYLAGEKDKNQQVDQLINHAMEAEFEKGEARVLRRNIIKLNKLFLSHLSHGVRSFKDVKDLVFKDLRALEIGDEDASQFNKDTEILYNALPTEGIAFDFNREAPLYMVRQKLEQIEFNRLLYEKKIKRTIDTLVERLKLDREQKGGATEEGSYKFAESVIAMNKVVEMTPHEGSDTMDEVRIGRIKSIISALEGTISEKENVGHLIVHESLKDSFRWAELFKTCKISFLSTIGAFEKANQSFDRNIINFTKVLVTMRRAELEIGDKYEADVHDDFFDHFKWFKLNREELNIFPPVMIILPGEELSHHGLAPFAEITRSNKPIKVLAFSTRTATVPSPGIDWEDASFTMKHELTGLALSHRNAFVFQCASDNPEGFLTGIRNGMECNAPALFHVLIPETEEDFSISFLKINAANAARYFPYLMYNPDSREGWGSRFDVTKNIQPSETWPVYDFAYELPDGSSETLPLRFTYADYKAIHLEKVKELFLVPESMVNDYLIPIDRFLELDQNEQTGMVPYIWLVDEDHCMLRAALPYMWVASCLERVDFWRFIQELGGFNNYHVQEQTKAARTEWDAWYKKQIEDLEAKHQQEIAQTRRESAGIAMDKLASVLLNIDNLPTKSSQPAANVKPSSTVVSKKDQGEEATSEPETGSQEDEDEPATEAWIETFRCTSCNDCTEKYPAIFAYNDEKQAFVKDATKGTFEHLVLAAEICPADCIHPGLPLNPDEPNLEELKERAAKYN
ncbi:MAG: ferredoxin [SAR324 cluster bacterium]|nr:ferredoxin [SAR324 cluster bacterium]